MERCKCDGTCEGWGVTLLAPVPAKIGFRLGGAFLDAPKCLRLDPVAGSLPDSDLSQRLYML
jgi:hypothetical protein